MKYNTSEEFIAAADNLINRKVKHYLTDWTDIDRPRFLIHARETDGPDVLVARNCGTYLLPDSELRKQDTQSICVLSYYLTQAHDPWYYEIDYKKRSITKRKPEYIAQKYGIKMPKR